MHGKKSFEDIYNKRIPADYYIKLAPTSYVLPDAISDIFQLIYTHFEKQTKIGNLNILDIGCSYGTNSAIQKFGLSSSFLQARYICLTSQNFSDDEIIELDRKFFQNRQGKPNLNFIGVDISKNAIDYATRSGLLSAGYHQDLKRIPFEKNLRRQIALCDIVISTGTYGYYEFNTLQHIINCSESRPWLILTIISSLNAQKIQCALNDIGYQAEHIQQALIPQRLFTSATEKEHFDQLVRSAVIREGPLEAMDYYSASVILARPQSKVEFSAEKLLSNEWLLCPMDPRL